MVLITPLQDVLTRVFRGSPGTRNCVACAIQTETVKYGAYNAVAGRADSRFSWESGNAELGYSPEHNWPEIPDGAR